MRCRVLGPVLFASGLFGCASPCARVKGAHAEITERSQPVAAGDHLRLAVPMSRLNAIVAREVRGLPQARLPLPAVSGVSLGSASVAIQRVVVVPGAPSQVMFVIDASLIAGGRQLLPVQLTARVRPRLDRKTAQVVVALDKKGLVGVSAKLGRGGARALTDVLWAQLPAAARMLTSKGQVAELAGPLADRLLDSATTLIKGELLDDIGRVARVEIDLPPIPVDGINVRSTPDDLIVGVHTPLPTRGAIPANLGRTVPKPQVQLTIHAAAAVELINRAMRRGEVPARFGLDGVADAKGPLHAHLDWAGKKAKPLVVHAFLLDPQAAGRPAKDCAHVTLGATPRVVANKGHLVVSPDDAKVSNVSGSVAVKAGLFFGGVSRRSFEHVEQIAADTEFDLGAQTLRATVRNAALRGEHLVIGLALTQGQRRR